MSTVEDSSAANDYRIATDIACADCTFASNSNKMSENNTSVPVAVNTVVPCKLNSVTHDVDVINKGVHIDITDGKWHDIQVWKGRYVGNNSPSSVYETDQPGLVPINVFLGIPHKEDKYVEPFDATYSGDIAIHYLFHKINNITFTMRNFCVVVERDTSGGVQLMDDLIFEVRRIYHNTPGESTFAIPESSITSTLSDLNKGLSINIPLHTVGYLHKEDLYYQKKIVLNGKEQIYVAYFMLAHIVESGNTMNSLILPQHPFYGYQIRCINLPAGLTNIKVNLGYVTDIKSNITSLGRIYKTKIPFLQYPGELYLDVAAQDLEDGTNKTLTSTAKKVKDIHDNGQEEIKKRRR